MFGVSWQKFLCGLGYSGIDVIFDNDVVDFFFVGFSVSYEVDFWGGCWVVYCSVLESFKVSEYDCVMVELILFFGVVNSYLQVLVLCEQQCIVRFNLDNVEYVLCLVEICYVVGLVIVLEVVQQSSLVVSQCKQLLLFEQQVYEVLIILVILIGELVQVLQVVEWFFDSLCWLEIGVGLLSELFSCCFDIVNVEV